MDLSTSETVGSDTNELVVTPEKWLHTVVSPLLSRPSHDLECFLKSCDKDLTDEVTQMITAANFPYSSLGSAIDNIWTEERRSETLKLFYKVLQAMFKAEPDANNLNSLLVNERFHQCLLTCSAELVLTTHKIITMMFPAVLERTGVTAFDFSKVIEIFIRHEDSLPTELRHHLNSLEERLIESMVWEKGSSMYNSLIVARPSLASEINRLGLLAEPSLDTMLASINISGGETNAKTEIDNLLTKVKKLATVRINGTVERLKLSQQMKKSLYLLFIRLLVQQTSLFFNRHIDQIMLCCFYLVAAKIYRMNLTFREIIYDYRKQPLRQSNVFRSVFMEPHYPEKIARDHVDIITFYNEGFIPAVKPLLPKLIPMRNHDVVPANNKPEGEWPEVNTIPSTQDTPPFPRNLFMSYSHFSQSFNEGR